MALIGYGPSSALSPNLVHRSARQLDRTPAHHGNFTPEDAGLGPVGALDDPRA